jgi:hypothetical protein
MTDVSQYTKAAAFQPGTKKPGSPGVPVGLSGAGNGENPFDH